MKYIIIFFLSLLVIKANAQFSIRVNNTNRHAVDILYTAPPAGQGNIPVQFFEFALQIANPQGASLTATFTPGAPLASLTSFAAYTGVDNGKTTWAWASNAAPVYANTFNFTAAEVVLATVAFTPTAAATGADVFAIDYQNAPIYGGAGTGVAIWTMQVTPGGIDVTNYGSLFYKSTTVGTVNGSAVPNTNADYGTSNQQVGLTGGTLLPLKLLSFTATEKNCNAAIAWKTADEINTKNFEVQTSTDGTNFTNVATVAAKGGTSIYSVNTPQLATKMYYRLKSIDKDGAFTYSAIVPLTINCQGKEFITIAPNPVVKGGNTTLTFSTAYKGRGILKITNSLGQQLEATSIVISAGTSTMPISTKNWASGVYYITLVTDAGSTIGNTIKLINN